MQLIFFRMENDAAWDFCEWTSIYSTSSELKMEIVHRS